MSINLITENRFVEEKLKAAKIFKLFKLKMQFKYDGRCVLEKVYNTQVEHRRTTL